MKKISHISILILSFILFGCKNNSEYKKLNSYYQSQTKIEHPTAKIDFTKRKNKLIEDIETQIGINLCENGLLTVTTEFKSEEIIFPAYVFKSCEEFISIHNVVEIQINSDNRVIVYDELVDKNEKVSKKILKATKEMMLRKGRNKLLYSFNWEKDTKPESIKLRLIEILKAIKLYANSISLETFNKPIDDLNKNELNKLNEIFEIKIGFDDYEMLPPPKPPVPINNAE